MTESNEPNVVPEGGDPLGPLFGGDLKALAAWVTTVNRDNGWFEADRTFGDEVALLHSEVSEMLEEFRERGVDRYYEVPADESASGSKIVVPILEGGHYPSGWKPIGVPSEAADILIRLLDTCHRYGIDLENEVLSKLAFNQTRGHRHGGKNL